MENSITFNVFYVETFPNSMKQIPQTLAADQTQRLQLHMDLKGMVSYFHLLILSKLVLSVTEIDEICHPCSEQKNIPFLIQGGRHLGKPSQIWNSSNRRYPSRQTFLELISFSASRFQNISHPPDYLDQMCFFTLIKIN